MSDKDNRCSRFCRWVVKKNQWNVGRDEGKALIRGWKEIDPCGGGAKNPFEYYCVRSLEQDAEPLGTHLHSHRQN